MTHVPGRKLEPEVYHVDTVADLIEVLKKMPPGAQPFHVWDGEPRTKIAVVWFASNGKVMTADNNEIVRTAGDWPEGAESDHPKGLWSTPYAPEPTNKDS